MYSILFMQHDIKEKSSYVKTYLTINLILILQSFQPHNIVFISGRHLKMDLLTACASGSTV